MSACSYRRHSSRLLDLARPPRTYRGLGSIRFANSDPDRGGTARTRARPPPPSTGPATDALPLTNLLWIYPTLPTPYPLRGHVRHIHRRLVVPAFRAGGESRGPVGAHAPGC